MSSQSELNTYPWQFVLYYCNIINADATVYQTDLSNVCTLGFDDFGNITIFGWLIGGYAIPSPATLMSYVLATVLAAYDDFYTIPFAIQVAQPYSITTTKLTTIRADASTIGFSVYDVTAQANKTWTGSAWLTNMQRFLVTTGGSLTGNLGLNTSSFGSGTGSILGLANAATVPSVNPTAGGVIYVESGALKYRGSSGTVTTLAPA